MLRATRSQQRRDFVAAQTFTDSQWGYLSALIVVAKEALGERMDIPPFAEAHELWKNYELVGNSWGEENAA